MTGCGSELWARTKTRPHDQRDRIPGHGGSGALHVAPRVGAEIAESSRPQPVTATLAWVQGTVNGPVLCQPAPSTSNITSGIHNKVQGPARAPGPRPADRNWGADGVVGTDQIGKRRSSRYIGLAARSDAAMDPRGLPCCMAQDGRVPAAAASLLQRSFRCYRRVQQWAPGAPGD